MVLKVFKVNPVLKDYLENLVVREHKEVKVDLVLQVLRDFREPKDYTEIKVLKD